MVYTSTVLAVLFGLWIFIRIAFRVRRAQLRPAGVSNIVAFFHPYCNGGGGGERVLWILIAAMLKDNELSERAQIVIYTGDSEKLSAKNTLHNVKDKFFIDLCKYGDTGRIRFVHIKTRHLLEGNRYKRFTMLMQSLASVLVGLECLLRHTPDVYFDTMGATFTYPAARLLAGCRVLAYVHYPIISQDMLQRVREQRPQYNNDARITSSVTVSYFKLFYYQIFAVFYSMAGRCAELAFVNSSWTEGHISGLWGTAKTKDAGHYTPRLVKVFPPCNSEEFSQISLDQQRETIVLSVGQFRPEKDHMLQIKALKLLIATDPNKYGHVKLVLIGGSRNAGDDALVEKLKLFSRTNDDGTVSEKENPNVEFIVNAPFSLMREYMKKSLIGLHTMWNEHFGISVVELMAAGLVVIAHDSGGPSMDIVCPAIRVCGGKVDENVLRTHPVGLLATTAEQYADSIRYVVDHEHENYMQDLRVDARKSCSRFSDDVFERDMTTTLTDGYI